MAQPFTGTRAIWYMLSAGFEHRLAGNQEVVVPSFQTNYIRDFSAAEAAASQPFREWTLSDWSEFHHLESLILLAENSLPRLHFHLNANYLEIPELGHLIKRDSYAFSLLQR
jgi:hypothetical protein